MPTAPLPCPCGLPAAYTDCCGRFHAGAAAPSAEALMRSRYSAFVLGLTDYLLATWHATTRPAEFGLDDSPKWLGLTVLAPAMNGRDKTLRATTRRTGQEEALRLQKNSDNATLASAAPPTTAEVEFIARYKVGGRAYRLHERSRFVHEDGRWFYVDGDIRE